MAFPRSIDPIEEGELSVRAANRLFGFATWGDVAAASDDDLLKIEGFGLTTLREVRLICENLRPDNLLVSGWELSWGVRRRLSADEIAVDVVREFRRQARGMRMLLDTLRAHEDGSISIEAV